MLTGSLFATSIALASAASAQLTEAFTGGKIGGNFNLRFESVNQDNTLGDAEALTLSSRLSYTTGNIAGFTALLEMEDVSVVSGIDSYSVSPTGFKPGEFSVIADPETTEIDQALLQYSNQKFTAKLGRQVMTFDNHRFIGHVGWRQDRQSFDGVSFQYQATENINLSFNYIDKRRRIFAEDADIDSKDSLFHASYHSPFGNFTGYAYLLEEDNSHNSLDTYGLRYNGVRSFGNFDFDYLLEYARQDSTTATVNYEADYLLVEAGLGFEGITAKVGYEILGSDHGDYGFSTPLATLHAFNGWADIFLATPVQGLTDLYLNVGGNALSGNWSVIYHDFNAVDTSPGLADFGSELDLQFVLPISPNYSVGIKYAMYSDGDMQTGRPETDKFWLWLNARF